MGVSGPDEEELEVKGLQNEKCYLEKGVLRVAHICTTQWPGSGSCDLHNIIGCTVSAVWPDALNAKYPVKTNATCSCHPINNNSSVMK